MIPEKYIQAQDYVDIADKGDGDKVGPSVMRMHVSDALHAMAVEPDRYSVFGMEVPAPVVVEAAEAAPVPEVVTESNPS